MAIYWLYFKSEILAFEVHSETHGWEKMSQIYFQAIPRGSEEMERKRRHCADGPRVPGSLIFSAFVVVWYFSTTNGCYKQEWFFFQWKLQCWNNQQKRIHKGKIYPEVWISQLSVQICHLPQTKLPHLQMMENMICWKELDSLTACLQRLILY